MMHNKKYLLFLVLSSLYFTTIKSQDIIPATGGNASGSSGSVSYTIGQIVYNTFSGSTGSIVQGVQQPYEISIPTAIENTEGIILECLVYPNPTTDFLTLKIKNYDRDNLSYKLYNINGNILEDKKIQANEIKIPLGNYVSGTYFIKVTDNNKDLKTFKIIKN